MLPVKDICSMNTDHSRIALTALSTSVELVDVLLESLDKDQTLV